MVCSMQERVCANSQTWTSTAYMCLTQNHQQFMTSHVTADWCELKNKSNDDKTQTSKESEDHADDGQRIGEVDQFKYLGSINTNDGRCLKGIRMRVGMAKTAFWERKKMLTGKLNRNLKKRLIKMLVVQNTWKRRMVLQRIMWPSADQGRP